MGTRHRQEGERSRRRTPATTALTVALLATGLVLAMAGSAVAAPAPERAFRLDDRAGQPDRDPMNVGRSQIDVFAAARPADYRRLSNEHSRTRVAYVDERTYVRRSPSLRSRRVKLLRPDTWYGLPERVLVLGVGTDSSGREWARVRYPGRYDRRGWVVRSKLSRTRLLTTKVVIDRRRKQLRLYRRGKRIMTARVGVGAKGSPTPGGRFYVRERLIPRNKRGIYGPRAFGLSSYSPYRTDWPGGGQVGIHGTNQPRLIPGRISNGCVRLTNRAVLRLDRRMPIGTPVLVK